MSETEAGPESRSEYRIEDLAHASGATVRTIRSYQDRGLLPTPERRGRANVYRDTDLTRLRQIAGLLDRGYTLASIKELLDAWDTGRGLGGVLGLAAEVDGPWTDEAAGRVSRAEPDARFEFTTEHVFARYLGHRPPSDIEAAEAASLVRRLRPLAQHAVNAELARAMRTFANRHLNHHLDARNSRPESEETRSVPIPAATMLAVQKLVGAENVPAFVAAATEREVQARTLDALASTRDKGGRLDQ